MTVYELIQALTKYSGDMIVEINAKINGWSVDCDDCNRTLDIDGDEYTLTIESVREQDDVVVLDGAE